MRRAASANRRFKFEKRSQPFIGPRNEMLFVVAYFTLTHEPSCTWPSAARQERQNCSTGPGSDKSGVIGNSFNGTFDVMRGKFVAL